MENLNNRFPQRNHKKMHDYAAKQVYRINSDNGIENARCLIFNFDIYASQKMFSQ